MFPEFFHKTFYLIYEFLFLYYNLSHGGLVKYKCSLFLLLSWGSEGFKKMDYEKKHFISSVTLEDLQVYIVAVSVLVLRLHIVL